ncbi:MAG: NADP-dependent isocitrate dehydrogenase [Deltaproteobacteria bacterium]|nr:MAG: NADP-dependent isocitrate dehydrogenase [Deltaproteobacteria bacterium]
MSTHTPITVARGDGIGPEITDAVLRILDAAGASLDIEEITIGESVWNAGHPAGITPDCWDSLRRTKVFLKGPVTTPYGKGVKSLNVTVRKSLGLYANVRPVRAYAPFVRTKHPGMDVVVVRENEEDLYAGIEHRQTDEVRQCLKLVSRPGTERIVRYAFEFARSQGRKKVASFVKDNIMKITDGLFTEVFEEVAAEYDDVEKERYIVDIGSALLADRPGMFDVIVTTNLYGDIISDIAAQIAGSVGLAGSANIGDSCAMFEAVHGSAPDIAGQGIANPSGLLNGALLMLRHIGQGDVATKVENAWLKTLEDGVHTGDIYDATVSSERVGTAAFADAVIARLGQEPSTLPKARAGTGAPSLPVLKPRPPQVKKHLGADVFVDWAEGERSPDALAQGLIAAADGVLPLIMISNRGVKVWPDGMPETFCTDHWRCRFQAEEPIDSKKVGVLISRLIDAGFDVIKHEGLCTFDGQPGFSRGQGQ